MTNQEAYDQVAFYTLEHARTDPSFTHQYIVDAYAAQHAAQSAQTIRTAFALIGLYLHIEKHYSGREVQLAHIQLGKKRKQWPAFKTPEHPGTITVTDVLHAKPGADRDQMIEKWCVSVWGSWRDSQQEIRELLGAELGI